MDEKTKKVRLAEIDKKRKRLAQEREVEDKQNYKYLKRLGKMICNGVSVLSGLTAALAVGGIATEGAAFALPVAVFYATISYGYHYWGSSL